MPLRRWAIAGLVVEFLALFRCLAEVFRLRALRGAALPADAVLPFVTGAGIAATGVALSTTALLLSRPRLALVGSLATVLALVGYRVFAM